MYRHSIKAVLNDDIGLDKRVQINGWVRSRRTSKSGFSFLTIHDGSCFSSLQVVADQSLLNYEVITEIATGTALCVTGEVVQSQGQEQDRELRAERVEIIGAIEDPESYPIAKKRHSFEYLRSMAHLRPRTNTFGAIARVRNAVAQAVHNYFATNGFVWINTPIITATDCEGTGELFRVST
ncbi:MAG TPA: asparagine--tRNA ligase, partial [Pseudomonadales bacterium]|nr:asparagine--tRNA ligase [Pseudomonadales bacterium]